MKESKRTTILTTIVCLIPILVGIILYNRMPDQMATHWNFDGVANDYSSKFTALIVFPGILAVINVFFPVLLRVDPKYDNLSDKIKALLHWIIPVVEVFASATTVAAGLGAEVKVSLFGPIFLGMIFTWIGNYLPKISQTYTVGIKLPWTLEDEENWNQTHRLAGFVWVACGILMILMGFLPFGKIGVFVLCGIMIVVPTVYSYVLYTRKHGK